MCTEPASARRVRAAMPHPAAGSAADPIALEPADDVVLTTLADNVYDAPLTSDDTITRAPLAAGTAQAPELHQSMWALVELIEAASRTGQAGQAAGALGQLAAGM